MFRPSAGLALANALASCSFRKVSVFLMSAPWPGSRSFGSNETYQVPLDLLGRGLVFIFPSPSARQPPVRVWDSSQIGRRCLTFWEQLVGRFVQTLLLAARIRQMTN